MEEIPFSGQLTQDEVAAAFYMGSPQGRLNFSAIKIVIGFTVVVLLLTLVYSSVQFFL